MRKYFVFIPADKATNILFF